MLYSYSIISSYVLRVFRVSSYRIGGVGGYLRRIYSIGSYLLRITSITLTLITSLVVPIIITYVTILISRIINK